MQNLCEFTNTKQIIFETVEMDVFLLDIITRCSIIWCIFTEKI